MRHLLRPAAGWTVLILVLALALPPAALADERDPRCADWQRNGAPPGTDMALMCPPAGPTEATVDLDAEPLFPYLVALVVVAAVLVVFGIVAMRWTAPPTRPRPRATAYWTCAACGTMNQPARNACFSCHSSRADGRAADPPAHEPAPTHPA